MRGPQGFLMIVFCLAAVTAVMFAMSSGSPAKEARIFLSYVRGNNYGSAVREFGDNTCHCAPEGGYGAFLRYDQAHDPNLAFLMGTNFTMAEPTVKKLPYNGEKYMMPWDKPEDTAVFVPITFPDPSQRPFFLPLDMAFGHQMSEDDVKSFVADPSLNWRRGFTLRLREKLKGTAMTPPGAPKPPPPESDAALEQILPKGAARYMTPADASSVVLKDGRVVAADQFKDQLPRLKSITVGLKIVRAGWWRRWAIKKVGVQDIVVTSNGKDFELHEQPAARK